jgi:hypothetical protein
MCTSSINLFAQNTNSGDIRGTATDSAGAVIPGVTVTVRDKERGNGESTGAAARIPETAAG